MINHYNAFISYKHAPEDNKVADAVHKGLERFHIPGKLRKKTGIKKINRIFRDKAELPITNDLSDNISDALSNSDYLIVLCSTNTKESAWVPREIEAFLENHTKRDIFTVLVNGEPRDVIPEILQYEERTVTAEDGSSQTVKMPIEPLSCDYRMPLRKAKKTELPRLASGLIGCAYDEIMNRHRAYRMKVLAGILSIAFAVVLGFAGYMFYSRNQINKNYLESLKNQSRYLANESEDLLEKERRITALQLALEALPKDKDDDRPVTAEAVRALTYATLAYEGNDGTNINDTWNYTMPNKVNDFKVSNDGKHIALFDSGNIIGVWDTKTHKRTIYIEDMPSRVFGIGFPDDNSLVVWTEKNIYCYDVGSGEKRWDFALPDDIFKENIKLMTTDKTIYISTEKGRYIEFDLTSGSLGVDISLPDAVGKEDLYVIESMLSPDKKKIAFGGMTGSDNYVCGVVDIATEKAELSGVMSEAIRNIEWIGNDTIVVAGVKVDKTSSMRLGTMELVAPNTTKIRCVNASDMTEKWIADSVCYGVNINRGFLSLGDDAIAYYSGNVITVYDLATGEIKYTNNVNDSIVDVSDRDGDGTPLCITENGGYAIPAPSVGKDAVYYKKYFCDDLRQVVVNGGVYARQNYAREVIYYGVGVYDEAWTPLSESIFLSNTSEDWLLDEQCLMVLGTDAGKPALRIFPPEGGDKCAKVVLDGAKAYSYDLFGLYDDRIYLGYENGDSYELVSCTVSGEDVKKDALFSVSSAFEKPCTMKDGKLVYLIENDNYEKYLVIKGVSSEDKKEIKLPDDIGFTNHAPVCFENESAVYLSAVCDYIINTETGTVNKPEVPDGWGGATCFSANGLDGNIAVSDGKSILLADSDGKIKNTISCPGVSPLGMTFNEGELMVLYADGELDKYDVNNGQSTRKMDISVYADSKETALFDFDEANNLLYVSIGMLTDVIDMESGVELARIESCFGHHMGKDIFITESKETSDKVKVGYYKRYSLDELIEKAHDILKGAELSDAARSKYGIESDAE